MSFSKRTIAGIVTVVVVCTCVFALAGCGSNQQGSSSSSAGSDTKAVTAGYTYSPISLTLFNDDLEFEFASTNGWEQDGKTYIQFNVNVENEGSDVDEWSINVPFNGDVIVSDCWDCSCSVDGSTLAITNADYNGSIASDGSVKGVGFIVCGDSNLGIFL